MKNRSWLNKSDIIIFAALTAAALIFLFFYRSGGDELCCEIKINGKTAYTITLSEPESEFVLPENPGITFKFKNNAAAFLHSGCPDKICVKTGYIKYPGQSAVCLPNRVSIHITGEHGFDAFIN